MRAVIVASLIAVASTNGFAREQCLYELSPPEAPYYVAGSLVTPQSNSLAVAECGKTVEEVKADIERAYQEQARAEEILRAGGPDVTGAMPNNRRG